MAPAPDPVANSPRAFSQAAGLVLQMVGIVLTLGTCCWWSFTGLTQKQLHPATQPTSLGEVVAAADPLQIWSMTAVCISFAGGLALAALGLGLQAEKRRSGTIAACTAGCGTAFWFVYFAFAISHAAGVGRLIWIVFMLLAWGLCAVLSVISADELKRNPPPPDLGKAPADLKPDRLIDREMPPDLRA